MRVKIWKSQRFVSVNYRDKAIYQKAPREKASLFSLIIVFFIHVRLDFYYVVFNSHTSSTLLLLKSSNGDFTHTHKFSTGIPEANFVEVWRSWTPGGIRCAYFRFCYEVYNSRLFNSFNNCFWLWSIIVVITLPAGVRERHTCIGLI
jgi:hypothetical protein